MRAVSTRRQFLTVIGVAQTAMGLTYVDEQGLTVPRREAFDWIALVEPRHLGVMLLVTGMIALVTAGLQSRKARWVDVLERWAFSLAVLPFVTLATVFVGSQVVSGSGITSAISYAAWTALVYLAAGVVDPARKEPPV